MSKTYFNSMITGNSEMLGCLANRGELVRLFWPHIDYPQHIDRFITGVTCPAAWQGASWLHSEAWQVSQRYIDDTNVAVTVYNHIESGLTVTQTDFVHPDRPVYTRCYEVENKGGADVSIGFVAYSSSVTTSPHPAGILFEQ